jgi:hypothetical protein
MNDLIGILSQQNIPPKSAPRLAHSIKHAAERVDLGTTKIWQLIGDGRLAAIKIDGRTLITEEALRELLAQSPLAVPEVGTWSGDHPRTTGVGYSRDLPTKGRSPKLNIKRGQKVTHPEP